MKLKMNLEGKLLQILTTFPEKYFLCHDLAFSNFAVSNFQQTIMTALEAEIFFSAVVTNVLEKKIYQLIGGDKTVEPSNGGKL